MIVVVVVIIANVVIIAIIAIIAAIPTTAIDNMAMPMTMTMTMPNATAAPANPIRTCAGVSVGDADALYHPHSLDAYVVGD
jgi:hypothetical protein